jgi:hypothetical protein
VMTERRHFDDTSAGHTRKIQDEWASVVGESGRALECPVLGLDASDHGS